MRKPLGIVIGVVLTIVGAPSASAIRGAAMSSGGMKTTVFAKGDCANIPTAILITDSTTSCSIEIRVTPMKRYADVSIRAPLTSTSFCFPEWIDNDGKARLSTSDRGLVTPKREAGGCLLVSGTARVIAQLTNTKTSGGSFMNAAKSKPITVTYQQVESAIWACYCTLYDN